MKTIKNHMIKLPENCFGIIQFILSSMVVQGYKLLEIFIGDNISEKKLQSEIFTNPILIPVKRKE
jgi:hypothetical protein